MSNPIELRAKRKGILLEAERINDAVIKRDGVYTQDETDHYDRLWAGQLELKGEIDTAEQANKRSADLSAALSASTDDNDAPLQPETRDGKPGRTPEQDALEQRLWARAIVHQGNTPEVAEYRAIQADVATGAGFLVTPNAFQHELIQNVKDATVIGGLARHFTMPKAEEMLFPTLVTGTSTWAWGSELTTSTADTALEFGRRALKPNPAAGKILISNTLLRQSAMDVRGIVMAEMTDEQAVFVENTYMTGNGINQPLGVFTASANGIPTARDVSTGNTGTAITVDGLKEAKYFLKEQYRRKASWVFNRTVIKDISKLKDGESRYLWQDSIVQNEPDRLLGAPVRSSEHAPNTMTTGLYVGMLADWSKYWVVNALTLETRTLTELYAESNQVLIIMRIETDAAPVRSEAFARVTLG